MPFLSIKNLLMMHRKTNSLFYLTNHTNLIFFNITSSVIIPLAFVIYNLKAVLLSRRETMGGNVFNLYRDLLLAQMVLIQRSSVLLCSVCAEY